MDEASEGDEEGNSEADEMGEAGEEASPKEDTGQGISADVRWRLH